MSCRGIYGNWWYKFMWNNDIDDAYKLLVWDVILQHHKYNLINSTLSLGHKKLPKFDTKSPPSMKIFLKCK